MADGLLEIEGHIIALLPGQLFRIDQPNKQRAPGTISG